MKRKAKLLLAAALVVVAIGAQAQDYPSRPIRLIVPFGAGGPTDIVARYVGDGMQRRLGQPVVVENRPGGATVIAMQAVAQSDADGYTLAFAANSFLTLPATMEKLPVDPVQAFTPVTKVVQGAQLLQLSTTIPAGSVKELLVYAKANPGKVNFGGTASQELIRAFITQSAGVTMTSVPYKSHDDVVRAFAQGDVHLIFDNIGAAKTNVASGKARILATMAPERSKAEPDIPALAETLPKVSWPWFYYVAGPAKLSDGVVNRLYGALAETAKEPEFAKRVAPLGGEPLVTAPRALQGAIAEEVAQWIRTAKAAGLKKE